MEVRPSVQRERFRPSSVAPGSVSALIDHTLWLLPLAFVLVLLVARVAIVDLLVQLPRDKSAFAYLLHFEHSWTVSVVVADRMLIRPLKKRRVQVEVANGDSST